MKKLHILLLILFTWVSAFAQTPQNISYQAVIRDANGFLVKTKMIGVQVSVLQGSINGSPVYVETHTPTTNANGLMSFEIGNGTIVSGSISTIDWTNGPYFVKTESDLDGGSNYTISGTSPLLAVPYALHANIADSLVGGISEADPIFSNSIAGTITTADTTRWNQTIDSSGVAALGFVAGPHTVNTDDQTLSLSGTTLTIANGNNLDLSSINTNTQLDSSGVAALGFVAGPHTINTDDQTLSLSGTTLTIANGNNVDLSSITSSSWDTTGNDLYYNSGNIGIGTNAPQYSLEVNSTNGKGIYSLSNSSVANTGMTGVAQSSNSNNALMVGVSGKSEGNGTSTGTGNHIGVWGRANGIGQISRGIEGEAVSSSTSNMYNQGVFGIASGIGNTNGYNSGIVGTVNGHSHLNYGLLGLNPATGNSNYGGAFFSYGSVSGSKKNYGVYGYSWGADTNFAVYGYAKDDFSAVNYGVYAEVNTSTGSKAGYFIGDVAINGNLSVTGSISKGSGTFKIDHPQDPENKYLIHSFVESPEMMNVYNGNITTDSNGMATVVLPDYFESNNKDFRYQLTAINQFAQCIIKEEVSNNSFVIQTNVPNVKVSWQVTGVRNDPYANQNRIKPVVDKTESEKGLYLHPEVYGQDPSKAIYKPIGNKDSKNEIEILKNSVQSSSNKEQK